MVTATLAGMILNWSAPVLLVVLAALAAAVARGDFSRGRVVADRARHFRPPDGRGPGALRPVDAEGTEDVARFGGDLLGWLFAATALLGAGWLVAVGYRVIPAVDRISLDPELDQVALADTAEASAGFR